MVSFALKTWQQVFHATICNDSFFLQAILRSWFKFKSSIQSLSEHLTSLWSRCEALNIQMCRWGIWKVQSEDTLVDNSVTTGLKAGWKRAYFAQTQIGKQHLWLFCKALKWQRKLKCHHCLLMILCLTANILSDQNSLSNSSRMPHSKALTFRFGLQKHSRMSESLCFAGTTV